MKKMKFKKTIIALIIITGFITLLHSTLQLKTGENLDSCKYFKLPKDATSISYWTRATWPCYAYEFNTSKESFLEWMKTNGNTPVKEISEPYEIRTYKSIKTVDLNSHTKTINTGLKFEWRKEDIGIYYAYDLEEKRAYVFGHTR